MRKSYWIRIFGSVQGVFFRASAQTEARSLGLTGFARNEPDGSVHVEIEGLEDDLKRFVAWCQEGPRAAQVVDLEMKEQPLQNFESFITE